MLNENHETSRGWRESSEVNSSCCSCREPGSVPSTHMATHNQHQLAPGLGEQMASSGLHADQAHTLYTDIYADNTHMDIIIYIKILTRHQ